MVSVSDSKGAIRNVTKTVEIQKNEKSLSEYNLLMLERLKDIEESNNGEKVNTFF